MNEWLKRRRERLAINFVIKFRCGMSFLTAPISFVPDDPPSQIVNEIARCLTLKDGSSNFVVHSVFDSLIYNGTTTIFRPYTKIYNASIYSPAYREDFSLMLNSEFTLRMNRYCVAVDNCITNKTHTGSCVDWPIGENGTTDMANGTKVHHGPIITV